MTRNMTLSIDDELAKKMDKMKEINRSQVAREAFAKYIATRTDPEISEIIDKLDEQRSQQYSKGLTAALNFANDNQYEDLKDFFENYEFYLSGLDPISRNKEESKLNCLRTALRSYHVGTGHKTQEFLRGFNAGLMKIKKGLGE